MSGRSKKPPYSLFPDIPAVVSFEELSHFGRRLGRTAIEVAGVIEALRADIIATALEVLPRADPENVVRGLEARAGRQVAQRDDAPEHELYDTYTLNDGRTVTMRLPREEDRQSIESLYADRLTDDDRRKRFFTTMRPQLAAQYGITCSSIDGDTRNHDFVVIGEEGHVVGHAGYIVRDGEASVHIVVDPAYRTATDQGERLSALMFEQIIVQAAADDQVQGVQAETLRDNKGVNVLVKEYMPGADIDYDGPVATTRIEV